MIKHFNLLQQGCSGRRLLNSVTKKHEASWLSLLIWANSLLSIFIPLEYNAAVPAGELLTCFPL
jgi:hypothetical protein